MGKRDPTSGDRVSRPGTRSRRSRTRNGSPGGQSREDKQRGQAPSGSSEAGDAPAGAFSWRRHIPEYVTAVSAVASVVVAFLAAQGSPDGEPSQTPIRPDPIRTISEISQVAASLRGLAVQDAAGAAAADPQYERHGEETGLVSVDVPAAWSEVHVQDWKVDEIDVGDAIYASSNIGDFVDGWQSTGVFVGASRELVRQTSMEALLDERYEFHADRCAFEGRYLVETPEYRGVYDLWSSCGGAGIVALDLYLVPRGSNILVRFLAHVSSEEEVRALDHMLDSLSVGPELGLPVPNPDYVVPVDPPRVRLSDLDPGTCFDLLEEPTADARVRGMLCDRPHEHEVFAVATYGTQLGTAYPGDDESAEFARLTCQGDAFTTYVGRPYGESRYAVNWVTASPPDWEPDSRAVTCFLSDPEGAPLERSARDSDE